MREQFVDIKTAEGVMEAFVTQPEQGGPFPAVILYMDIWGVREELYDIARRVGTVGYYCLVPDLYYRAGKRIHYDFRNPKNQTISMNRLTGEAAREIETRPKLTNKMVLDDTGASLNFLADNDAACDTAASAPSAFAWAAAMSWAQPAPIPIASSRRPRYTERR